MSNLRYVPAQPVAFGGGPCNRLYGLVPGAGPQDPALLIPQGTAVPAQGATFERTPLRPVAATAGAFMFNTYAVDAAPAAAAALAAQAAQVTPYSFGPLTNAAVMGFDAVLAPPALPAELSVPAAPARLVAMGRPWPVAETAVGYVAQQDLAAGRRFLAPVPSGPGCFMPSWPGATTITKQGTWTATPWRGMGWGCGGLGGGGNVCPGLL